MEATMDIIAENILVFQDKVLREGGGGGERGGCAR